MCLGTRTVVVVSSDEVDREHPVMRIDEGGDSTTLLVHSSLLTEEGAALITAAANTAVRLKQPRSALAS